MHVWCGRLIKKQILSYSITFLFIGIAFSGCLDDSSSSSSETEGWVDPIVESENCENCTGLDQNHQHTNLMQHCQFVENVALS